VAHAAFEIVELRIAGEVAGELFFRFLEIPGKGEEFPGVYSRGFQFRDGIPQHFRPAFVEVGLACLEIPFPGAEPRAVYDAAQLAALGLEPVPQIHLLADVDHHGEEKLLTLAAYYAARKQAGEDAAVFTAYLHLDVAYPSFAGQDAGAIHLLRRIGEQCQFVRGFAHYFRAPITELLCEGRIDIEDTAVLDSR